MVHPLDPAAFGVLRSPNPPLDLAVWALALVRVRRRRRGLGVEIWIGCCVSNA